MNRVVKIILLVGAAIVAVFIVVGIGAALTGSTLLQSGGSPSPTVSATPATAPTPAGAFQSSARPTLPSMPPPGYRIR